MSIGIFAGISRGSGCSSTSIQPEACMSYIRVCIIRRRNYVFPCSKCQQLSTYHYNYYYNIIILSSVNAECMRYALVIAILRQTHHLYHCTQRLKLYLVGQVGYVVCVCVGVCILGKVYLMKTDLDIIRIFYMHYITILLVTLVGKSLTSYTAIQELLLSLCPLSQVILNICFFLCLYIGHTVAQRNRKNLFP